MNMSSDLTPEPGFVGTLCSRCKDENANFLEDIGNKANNDEADEATPSLNALLAALIEPT